MKLRYESVTISNNLEIFNSFSFLRAYRIHNHFGVPSPSITMYTTMSKNVFSMAIIALFQNVSAPWFKTWKNQFQAFRAEVITWDALPKFFCDSA